MEPISIREFQYPEDYSQVIGIWEKMEKGIRLGESDTPKEIEKKLLRDPELFLVAVCNGELIGAVIGGFDGRRGYIYHLAVVAMFRGQGVGSRLMEELESRLKAKGCTRCHLLVTNDNDEAKGFYLNHGWKPLDNAPFAKDLT
jgi:ribosomal protein S18 acetylase RimI-like enzyme